MKTLSNLSFSEIVPYIGTDNNKVKEILQSYGIQKKILTYLAHSLEEDGIFVKTCHMKRKYGLCNEVFCQVGLSCMD